MFPQNPANLSPIQDQSPPIINVPTTVPITGIGIRIDNVNQSLWQYIKQQKLWELILFTPLIIGWEIVVIILLVKSTQLHTTTNNSGTGRGFGYMIMLPVFIFSSWIYRLRKQFEDAFLEQFAAGNGYTFDKNGTVDEAYGTIFRMDGRQQVSDVVTGTYKGYDLRLFLYELTVGSGRYQQSYRDTVIELDLHGQLPNLLMANKHTKFSQQLNLTASFGVKNTVKLEGDFNEFFTLYAPPGNELEALEVFSPDTMALMEDASRHFTVEFAGNRIYIYSNGLIATTEQLTQIFTLAKQLVDKIAPLASRLQNDSAIVAAPINTLGKRSHSLFTSRLGAALGVGFTVLGIGVVVLVAFLAPASQQSSKNSDKGGQLSVESPAFTNAINQASDLNKSSTPDINHGPEIVTAATQALDSAQTNDQKDIAEYWIGVGYFWQHQSENVVSHEQRAIQYNEADPYAYELEGEALLNEGNPTAALIAENRAIELNPNVGSIYRMKALVLADMGRKSEAIASISQATTTDTTTGQQQDQQFNQSILDYINTTPPPLYAEP